MKGKIIFVTGTDTGAGKTLLTALMLQNLRSAGIHALAMKPFCSGGRGDVRLLQSLQKGELSDAEMNPFYFAKPVAPLAAARKGKETRLADAVRAINRIAAKCDCLLVEGSGGLMVPLGKRFLVCDLIRALDCSVVIAAKNQLGVINHVLLTVAMLEEIGLRRSSISLVLMRTATRDASTNSNPRILRELLPKILFGNVGYLGPKASTGKTVSENASQVDWVRKAIINRL